MTDTILNTLRARKALYKRNGKRKELKLSKVGESALSNNKLSRSFWNRWNSKHKSLTQKRQGNISINRALNCTKKMACDHLNDLAEELQVCGIFTNDKKKDVGVWTGDIDFTRVFNHDETPQFVNYSVDGSASGLVYAGKGDPCTKMIRENRECVTINSMVSFAGALAQCHVIFSGVGITSKMVGDIANLLVSTTESGMQNHQSLLAFYKHFNKYLTETGVKKPVVIVTDGHSSRFDTSVLEFLRDNGIHLFIGPPDNRALHHHYRNVKGELFNNTMTIDRKAFMLTCILTEVWKVWAPSAAIVNAARKVGVTPDGLDVNLMQQDKFEQAERCIETTENLTTPQPSTSGSHQAGASPQNIRHGSAGYWKHKYEKALYLINDMSEQHLRIEDIPGFLHISKVKPKEEKTKAIRVTQVHGSMEGKKILEEVRRISDQKAIVMEKKESKAKEKEGQKEIFLQCKIKCVCNKKVCAVSQLRQCSVCLNVLKSTCSKVTCKVDGKKPVMILSAAMQRNLNVR